MVTSFYSTRSLNNSMAYIKRANVITSSSLIGLFVSLIMFITKYYYENNLLVLGLIATTFIFVLIEKITVLQFCLIFLPFNTGRSIFGTSVMLYVLVIALLYTLLSNRFSLNAKIHLDFSFWLIFTLILIALKNVVVYNSFRELTFLISVVMFGVVINNSLRTTQVMVEFIPYGVVLVSFGILQLVTGNGVNYRWVVNSVTTQLSGTYEPNYYSLYLNCFLSLILFSSIKVNSLFKYFLIVLSSLLVVMVRSNTGIIVLLVIWLLRLISYIKKSNLKKMIIILGISILFLLVLLTIQELIISKFINSRLIQVIGEFSRTGDINRFTTGRTDIWTMYLLDFNQLPIIERLIGTSRGLFRDSFGIRAHSHNFWVDVLIETGIIGLFMYFLSLIILYTKYFKSNEKECSQYLGLSVLALFCIYSLSLSLYSERTIWVMSIILLSQSRRKNGMNQNENIAYKNLYIT